MGSISSIWRAHDGSINPNWFDTQLEFGRIWLVTRIVDNSVRHILLKTLTCSLFEPSTELRNPNSASAHPLTARLRLWIVLKINEEIRWVGRKKDDKESFYWIMRVCVATSRIGSGKGEFLFLTGKGESLGIGQAVKISPLSSYLTGAHGEFESNIFHSYLIYLILSLNLN